MRKIVWVDVIGGKVQRIFKSQKQAFLLAANPQVLYKDAATENIRRQVYDLQEGLCLWCGKNVKWDGGLMERMHMDEIVPKGKGGLVSLVNCQGLCAECHLQIKHGDRRPRFGESVK